MNDETYQQPGFFARNGETILRIVIPIAVIVLLIVSHYLAPRFSVCKLQAPTKIERLRTEYEQKLWRYALLCLNTVHIDTIYRKEKRMKTAAAMAGPPLY